MIFDCEDIHRVRLEMAEQYSKMSKDEARRAINEEAENTRRAIEEIRRAKAERACVTP
jgi:hypothetical protein